VNYEANSDAPLGGAVCCCRSPALVFSSKDAKLCSPPPPHILEILADANPDLVLINGTGVRHGKR
jgi:hypothetical protein